MGGTISKKGQVTIPVGIRKALGLNAGDRVAFEILDDGRVIVRAEKRPRGIENLIGTLRPPRQPGVDDWNSMRDKARRRKAAEERRP